ncbi:Type II/IV secretion system ATPase TadZ/CpaE, associated with Flp pilus assembly [Fimbriiglobus ruber]|uniref:Type II/IV secretion system ATPase TadZ/CpaE, associated with Flp pilus assembly n=1 Tax=Fimbriiglobus ruber TaxID=1908690 RepID=A0A225D2T0_9BACT|nr:Type II/IV secretion system ATPase TadZ/CpaE, associated with Flp pilus assembly [Fimbriiglobus ruber]
MRLARSPDAQLVLVLLEPDLAAAEQTISLAFGQTGGPIAAVTTAETPGLAPSGTIGVWSITELKAELARRVGIAERSAGGRRGRVIAVTAALTGSGVTTVATGLAFALAGGGSVLLGEFGAPVPELALHLDLKPQHSVGDLLRAGDRMDVSMIRHAAVRHPAGVDVLGYPPDTLAVESPTRAAARDFQVLLRAAYDWVVLDAGHPQPGGEELCRHADAVVVVTRLDLPALRLTRRYVEALTDAGVPAGTLLLAANRYGQSGLVPWRQAEKALALPVKAWLSDDPWAVNRALAEGQPLVKSAPRAGLTKELARLAADVRARFATAGA